MKETTLRAAVNLIYIKLKSDWFCQQYLSHVNTYLKTNKNARVVLTSPHTKSCLEYSVKSVKFTEDRHLNNAHKKKMYIRSGFFNNLEGRHYLPSVFFPPFFFQEMRQWRPLAVTDRWVYTESIILWLGKSKTIALVYWEFFPVKIMNIPFILSH